MGNCVTMPLPCGYLHEPNSDNTECVCKPQFVADASGACGCPNPTDLLNIDLMCVPNPMQCGDLMQQIPGSMDCECRPEYVRDDVTGNCVCPTGLEFDDNLQCVPVQPICEGLMAQTVVNVAQTLEKSSETSLLEVTNVIVKILLWSLVNGYNASVRQLTKKLETLVSKIKHSSMAPILLAICTIWRTMIVSLPKMSVWH